MPKRRAEGTVELANRPAPVQHVVRRRSWRLAVGLAAGHVWPNSHTTLAADADMTNSDRRTALAHGLTDGPLPPAETNNG
jgi:hypothetical protein